LLSGAGVGSFLPRLGSGSASLAPSMRTSARSIRRESSAQAGADVHGAQLDPARLADADLGEIQGHARVDRGADAADRDRLAEGRRDLGLDGGVDVGAGQDLPGQQQEAEAGDDDDGRGNQQESFHGQDSRIIGSRRSPSWLTAA
jgi:hypothetical protein